MQPQNPEPNSTPVNPPIQPLTPAPQPPQTPQPTVIQPTANPPVQPSAAASTEPSVSTPAGPQPSAQTSSGYSQNSFASGQPKVFTSRDPGAAQQQPVFSPSPRPKPSKKRLVLLAGLAILLLGATGAYALLGYVPNRPENVWATGFERTGQQMQTAINKLSEPTVQETFAKNRLRISGDVKFQETEGSLSFDTAYDKTKSDSKLQIKSGPIDAINSPLNLNAEIKTSLPDQAVWPNVFIKVSGIAKLIEGFGLGDFAKYDGKWIAFEQDFYRQYFPQNTSANSGDNSNITQEEYLSILNDALAVSQEYVFTDNPEKAVIVRESYKGTEESEGITALRYTASVHQENATSYCKALIDKMTTNKAFHKLIRKSESDIKNQAEDQKKNCEPKDKEKQEKQTFDIWIDKKYKLLHKLRFTTDLEKKAEEYRKKKSECENRESSFGAPSSFTDTSCSFYDKMIETGESYIEFGQVYKGDDNLGLFMFGKNDTNRNKNTLRSDVAINIKSFKLDGTVSYKDTSQQNPGTVNVKINTEPYDSEVDATKPAGAVSIQQIIRDFENTQKRQRLGATTDQNPTPTNNQDESVISRLLNALQALSN